jgi:hypothetical protein
MSIQWEMGAHGFGEKPEIDKINVYFIRRAKLGSDFDSGCL